MPTFITTEIDKIPDPRERQSTVVAIFNQAMEDRDYTTAIAICNYVIGGDERTHQFSCDWQMHCLTWLTYYWQNQFRESEKDSEAEDKAIRELMTCLWKFKWLISSLPRDINASLESIEKANQEMQEWYDIYHISPAMRHKALMEQNMLLGNVDAVREHFQKWQASEADEMNDCEACEQNGLVSYYHYIGDYAQAAKLAEPILSGKLTCGEVPHITYHAAIDSLIQIGETQRAKDTLKQAVAHIETQPEKFLHLIPQIIQLHAQLDDLETAEELLDEYNDAIFDQVQLDLQTYWHYLLAIAPFNEEALETAQNIAADFDQRNGNSYYQTQLEWRQGKAIVH
ncbi:hypothetical protein QDY71_03795 [Kingella negevensis]|uniref:Tetratricopeptide repeat protein n=1 Tax=Kingella negevensis TaxID=1522312 RepID=A0A238TDC6_9NEIS|nr:hypothetical protein [Kingella negevensis]MDK4679735.1 hypothetical protein [Kingella negevensis]MDK4682547.1 hypothetical protein [Kingella negevensis]MDK4684439.1 hypothetical protein [Kingella negevensis]MDK4690743.1 hypothetical protein [Kingella negevensis]MDK4694109.1 hypothetical protein [Kingella negevensis]